MKTTFKNKKGIGFGLMFAIVVFVLFGLTLYLFIIAENRISSSIGTEELREINSDNLEFYFSEAVKIGFTDVLEDMAEKSFVDKNECELTQDNLFILENSCKPDLELIKIKISEKVAEYVKNSIIEYPTIKAEIFCKIEQRDNIDFLICKTEEITLKALRKSKFFSYEISKTFNLNAEINLEKRLSLNSIQKIFDFASNCKDMTCKLNNDYWNLEKIEQEGKNLLFYFSTKNQFVSEKEIKPINWKFAVVSEN